jgi:selenocysteine lyase/cysteine desulfurase
MSNHNALAQVRAEFPVVNDYTYLNTASQGPWSNRTVQAVQHATALMQYVNTERAQAVPSPEPVARERLAKLINANPQDLVFTGNTTHGLNICAQGIDWRAGDNVVVPEHEFPSLAYTWFHLQQRGVAVRFVKWSGAGPTVPQIMEVVDERTRAVSCSVIKWDTGYRVDLETLGRQCHERGVLLIVDAIQAVGAQWLDVQASRVSALSTHGYKWLMAGFGIGALYVAPDAIAQIRPTFIGVQSVVGNPDAFEGQLNWQAGAKRYEVGGGNRLGQTALATSLELIEEVGINTIEEHTRELAELLYRELQRRSSFRLVSSPDPAHRTAIVVFTRGTHEQDAALVKQLEAQNIIVALRPLGVRVSPHFYNTEADIARLVDALPR